MSINRLPREVDAINRFRRAYIMDNKKRFAVLCTIIVFVMFCYSAWIETKVVIFPGSVRSTKRSDKILEHDNKEKDNVTYISSPNDKIQKPSVAIRNTEILMEKKTITLQKINNLKKLNKTYESATVLLWSFNYFFKYPSTLNCYPYKCTITKDRRRVNTSAAVLFDPNFVGMHDGPPTKPENQKWAFSSREPVPYARVSETLDKTINLKFTYHSDTDVYLGWGFYFPYGEYSWLPYRIPPRSTPEGEAIFAALERDTEEQRAINKRILKGGIKDKLALWIVSKCFNQPRKKYGKKLMQTGIQIDKLGHCGKPDPCKTKEKKNDCLLKMGEKYKFYLAFENHICKDYITEKSWLYLRRGMVPVALGADISTYEKVLPPNSFLHINNFTSEKALAEYLTYLDKNDEAYQRYHEWRKNYQIIYLGGDFIPMIRCDFCWNVFQPTKPPYKSMKDWYKC